MENFQDIAALFLQQHAAVQVSSPEGLAKAWVGLIDDHSLSGRMGSAARQLVASNRGATARSLERICVILEDAVGGAQ
jgi:3-deoxy-D-manno-octulosonic-acid transferase